MVIQEVIDKIIAYHPVIDLEKSCDGLKCGIPDKECTGIVTTCCASIAVIREAIRINANLIICHEPVFYSHMDENEWLDGKNEVFMEKMRLCKEHGIVIWRDHDRIHAHRPDGIRYGVMMELGWDQYAAGDTDKPSRFHIPQITVRELALYLKEKLGLNGVRIIGNMDAVVENVAMCGHIYTSSPELEATELLNRADVDVLIPGELIDWTTASYARDAGQLGRNKAILQIGHFNSEELGMKYAGKWIGELIDHKVPITFVRSADMFQYII